MKARHLTAIRNLTVGEVEEIMAEATRLKDRLYQGAQETCCAGKTLAMLFAKASLRTRFSFEVGMLQLGGRALYVSKQEIGLGEREAIKDVARVISRYVDIVMIRHPVQKDIVEFTKYASIPVINGLSSEEHPCQALGDLFTIRESFGAEKVKVAFVGDANNVATSLGELCVKLGLRYAHAAPKGFGFKESFVSRMKALAKKTGGSFTVGRSPTAAVKGAHAVYADVWASMGQEEEAAERRRVFADYMVDERMVAAARPDAIVMHCLPAHRGEEISDGVMDGSHSVVYPQAENRMHAQKALMKLLLAGA
jgi:ornithine carbamoyltransferase